MNYAYIRVSTESQTVENQRIVISDYAKKRRVREEGKKELTSGKLRYKLKEWIIKKF